MFEVNSEFLDALHHLKPETNDKLYIIIGNELRSLREIQQRVADI